MQQRKSMISTTTYMYLTKTLMALIVINYYPAIWTGLWVHNAINIIDYIGISWELQVLNNITRESFWAVDELATVKIISPYFESVYPLLPRQYGL